MKNKLGMGLVVASIVLASGCATILNEDTQRINVMSSNGEKIKGNIDGVPFEGPGIVAVQRANQDRIINVETEGCAKNTVMPKSVDPVFFVNILSGGAFGSTTDYASEKMWKYENSVTVNCQ